MFVKLVVYPEKGTKETTNEFTYECKKYSFRYDPDNWEEGILFFNGSLTEWHTINLHRTDVYIMSDTGKTIDSLSWNKDEERKRCVRK